MAPIMRLTGHWDGPALGEDEAVALVGSSVRGRAGREGDGRRMSGPGPEVCDGRDAIEGTTSRSPTYLVVEVPSETMSRRRTYTLYAAPREAWSSRFGSGSNTAKRAKERWDGGRVSLTGWEVEVEGVYGGRLTVTVGRLVAPNGWGRDAREDGMPPASSLAGTGPQPPQPSLPLPLGGAAVVHVTSLLWMPSGLSTHLYVQY